MKIAQISPLNEALTGWHTDTLAAAQRASLYNAWLFLTLPPVHYPAAHLIATVRPPIMPAVSPGFFPCRIIH
jgi:hypothetical protein